MNETSDSNSNPNTDWQRDWQNGDASANATLSDVSNQNRRDTPVNTTNDDIPQEQGLLTKDPHAMTWKEIQYLVLGSVDTDNETAQRALETTSSPQSFYDAGATFDHATLLMDDLMRSVVGMTNGLVGDGGAWQGDTATKFASMMDAFISGIQSRSESLWDYGNQMRNAGNALYDGIQKIVYWNQWGANEALSRQAAYLVSRGTTVVAVSTFPEIVNRMQLEMAKALVDLNQKYSIARTNLPALKTLNYVTPNGGGPTPKADPGKLNLNGSGNADLNLNGNAGLNLNSPLGDYNSSLPNSDSFLPPGSKTPGLSSLKTDLPSSPNLPGLNGLDSSVPSFKAPGSPSLPGYNGLSDGLGNSSLPTYTPPSYDSSAPNFSSPSLDLSPPSYSDPYSSLYNPSSSSGYGPGSYSSLLDSNGVGGYMPSIGGYPGLGGLGLDANSVRAVDNAPPGAISPDKLKLEQQAAEEARLAGLGASQRVPTSSLEAEKTALQNSMNSGRGGMPMMPGAGMGGAPQPDRGRDRNTWLVEDEETWGAETGVSTGLLGR
ncbi:hypothetical protein [Kitasatospora sp. NPDC093102]|uniref:WXG100 family type VII secretion target n=1 Tax=Kitasatospora sp. NPDC093102 TaxID=3155069 RepID=UPI00343DE7C9